MKNKNLFGFLLLLATAMIWGSSFIAQAGAVKSIEALTFMGVRSPLGAIILIPFIMWQDRRQGRGIALFDNPTAEGKRDLLLGGLLCGLFMVAGTFFQTIGLYTTTVAKSGFLTAIYVILVPILGSLFLKTFVRRIEWIAALISCIGMYFICINEGLTIDMGDIYTIICAFCYAGQCLAIGIYAPRVDCIRLSFLQLVVASVAGIIGALIFETVNMDNILKVMPELLYAGVLSAGVAYTLQIVGQAYVSTSTAVITLSLESVFALISGVIVLHQVPTLRELCGCGLVFAAVLVAQLPLILSNKVKMQ